jgi:hypothetical protein
MGPSETIPYLVGLLAHELQHASIFETQIELHEDDKRYNEAMILDEARAFKTQIGVYIEAIKKAPELFCNWTFPTSSYGNLLVPLSWSMASIEHELYSGELMDWYVTKGSYKDESYLRSDTGKQIRPDLKEKIDKILDLKRKFR